MVPGRVTLHVYGLVHEKRHQKAKAIALELASRHAEVTATVSDMLPVDYEEVVSKFCAEADRRKHIDAVLVTKDGKMFGGLVELQDWALAVYKYEDTTKIQLYSKRAKKEFSSFLKASGCAYAYMDVSIDGEPAGRVIFQLFLQHCPETCENFIGLCNKHAPNSYINSIFHRVVAGAWIQGGDVASSNGDGGASIYGESFADESFAYAHTGRYDLGMASAAKHANRSQFYVALSKLSHLDRKKVVFGRLIAGSRVFKVIEKLECNNQRPIKTVQITDCGQISTA